MKRYLPLLAYTVFFAMMAAAQPVITDVQNGASYDTEIAAGSIFIVKGSGLSPAGFVQSSALPLTTTLNGASISFTPAGGGTAASVYMIYAYNTSGVNQLAGLLPSTAAPGDYDVRVARDGQTSASFRTKVVPHRPGIITADSSGRGVAQASTATYELIRFTNGQLADFQLRPVHPGEAVVLWVTGLGADAISDASGGSSGDLTAAADVQVLVGGIPVTPFYAGRASQLPGTDQVNFFVPESVVPSCAVTVQVRAGGVLSNSATITVAPAGASACESAAFTEVELRQLSQGDTVLRGLFNFQSHHAESHFPGLDLPPSYTEIFYGGIARYTQNKVVEEGTSLPPGQCAVWRRQGKPSQLVFGVIDYQSLDAGGYIRTSGATFTDREATKLPDRLNEYFLAYATVGTTRTMTAGRYTIQAPGGADVGPFQAAINIPAFEWTNRASVTSIRRSSGLVINWTGAAPGWLNITGYGARVISGNLLTDPDNAILEAALFSCIADGAAGTFTVAPAILEQLPAVAAGSFVNGSLGVYAHHGSAAASFTAPLTAGGSVPGLLGYVVGYNKLVTIE